MSIKLLVADDSITIQKVIGIIFGGDDYSLTVVDNGKTAIEKAREICPDVLLIDALMPGMTGYEVSEAVRATPSLANKPILILTGSFEPFDEEKAKKCGADDFMAKPFESQQIINKVKELAELGIARTKAALPTQPSAAPIIEPEPTPVFATARESFAEPAAVQQNVVPSDIWGAFTTDVESAPAPVVSAPLEVKVPSIAKPVEFLSEPDVFAIVSEESDPQIIHPGVAQVSAPQSTGSQWIPVEEHTFEFEEEAVPETTPVTFNKQEASNMESSFGDISFEDEEPFQAGTAAATVSTPEPKAPAQTFTSAEPAFPSFEESAPFFTDVLPASEEPTQPLPEFTPIVSAPEPAATAEAPATVVAPVNLTEEQLKTALSAASKEVIERIVWEVVPDLAEALIKEAIRKIKNGM